MSYDVLFFHFQEFFKFWIHEGDLSFLVLYDDSFVHGLDNVFTEFLESPDLPFSFFLGRYVSKHSERPHVVCSIEQRRSTHNHRHWCVVFPQQTCLVLALNSVRPFFGLFFHHFHVCWTRNPGIMLADQLVLCIRQHLH